MEIMNNNNGQAFDNGGRILGSVDSMSYLPGYGRLDRIRQALRRRHRAGISDQWASFGARAFDIGLAFTKKDRAYFRHGRISYYTESVYGVMQELNLRGAIVKLTYEGPDDKDFNSQWHDRFRQMCGMLVQLYPNILFCGGCDNKGSQLYKFRGDGLSDPMLIDWRLKRSGF